VIDASMVRSRQRSVLLVDDVAMIRQLLRSVLESSGSFRVVGEAGDGESAIVAAGELRPDVVMLDLSMPGMDGLEALPLIRAAAPDAIIVVNSGFAAHGAARSALDAGATAYLEKGLPPDQIVARLLRALGGDDGDAVANVDSGERLDRVLASLSGLEPSAEASWWDSVLEHLTDGVVAVDGTGLIVAGNRSAARLLGFRELATGQVRLAQLGWTMLDASGAVLSESDWIGRVIAAGRDNYVTGQLVRGDDVLDVCAATVVGNAWRRFNAVVLTLTDASGTRQLEQSRGHAAAIAELVDEAVFAVDRKDRICSWSDVAAARFGWTQRDVVFRPVTTLFAPGSAVAVSDLVAAARSGERATSAVTAVRRDGTPVEVVVRAAQADTVTGWVTVVVV
jgi:PAS domain S-box-containing protein